jgi:hypothetical protein
LGGIAKGSFLGWGGVDELIGAQAKIDRVAPERRRTGASERDAPQQDAAGSFLPRDDVVRGEGARINAVRDGWVSIGS